uniref:Translocator protein n=2 Tax=Lygus hesperus TaxID=30085 RepID=A0A0A9Z4M8_LYGHE
MVCGEMKFTWLCFALIVLPNLGGWIGGIAVSRNRDWYNKLNQPAIAPPGWVYGPVWTILYCLMGFASYLVWEERKWKSWIPLTIYFLQLLLNWIWTWIFFEAKILLLALVEICLLDVAVAGCLVCFGIVRLTAGALLVPYMAWLILATYLNFYAHNNN